MMETKLKSVAAIKARIGSDMMVYNTIRAGKKKAAVAANLLGAKHMRSQRWKGWLTWEMAGPWQEG
jgi:hypothetical protein